MRLVGVCLILLALLGSACGRQSAAAPPEAEATLQPTATVAPQATPTATPPAPVRVSPAGLPLALPPLADLVNLIEPAVVSISVQSVARGRFYDYTNEGAGTGIIIRPDGYVATNAHVVQDARDIRVHLADGTTYAARLVGLDTVTDLAVVKIDASDLPTVVLGDSQRLRVGDWVMAVGNALALKGGPTVTLGIVSATGRTVQSADGDSLYDLIQTDAAINEGNSGGPLVNMAGEVVGINTAIITQAQGIGFAVSSAVAGPIIDSLAEKGRVVRASLGLNGRDMTPALASDFGIAAKEGALVTQIALGGSAYGAGIRVGDVITKMDDLPTPDMARFLLRLWTYSPGDKVVIEYVRGTETRSTVVELGERVG